MKEKCIVMFSGGLDSRLAVKIMQKKKFEVIAVFFKLPFNCSCEKEVKIFLKKEKVKLKIFDCTKGKLLQEYLEVIKKAKHGTGTGVNPCIDCRIFMFKKAKEFADKNKIDLIVSGEVTGQRPMSQQKNQIKLIEEESRLKERIYRPLIEIGISGRQRKKQIALAKKFKIKYPSPAGGCLLCEKALKKRLGFLLKRGLNEKEIKLVGLGRHFMFGKNWVIIGRNEQENKIIEKSKAGKIIEPDYPAPSAVVISKSFTPLSSNSRPRSSITFPFLAKSLTPQGKLLNHTKSNKIPLTIIDKVNKLIQAYSKRGDLKDRKKFDKWKL